MALDPQLQHYVDYYYSLEPQEDESELNVNKLRAKLKIFFEKATQEPLDSLKEIKDFSCEFEGQEIGVRAYTPSHKTTQKAVFFLRGCGFMIDNFNETDSFCSKLATSIQAKVFSINYPLSPENQAPIPAKATCLCFLKILSAAKEHEIEPKNFVVLAESSGGCVASCALQMLVDQNGPHCLMQMLITPVTQDNLNTQSYSSMGEGNVLSKKRMQWYLKNYLGELKEKQYALPLYGKNLKNLPKTTIITAGHDPLCDDGRLYAEKLRKEGVEVQYLCYPNFIHGFFKFMQIPSVCDTFNKMARHIKEELHA